ncbi:MAG: Holliday junction resolvase RuvX [Gammaproteobacteria bacterium]|nr:Holliday junction resolvase RuvX [Gammaproteobacteria bacterium]
MATVLGIDYGHKKIGFATGQTITGTTTPTKVIYHNGNLWNEIDSIFATWKPSIVVVGMPLLADGKPHPLEKTIETFINEIKSRYNVAVCRENEAYSSCEARDITRKKKNAPIDAEAAAVFLESWIRANS